MLSCKEFYLQKIEKIKGEIEQHRINYNFNNILLIEKDTNDKSYSLYANSVYDDALKIGLMPIYVPMDLKTKSTIRAAYPDININTPIKEFSFINNLIEELSFISDLVEDKEIDISYRLSKDKLESLKYEYEVPIQLPFICNNKKYSKLNLIYGLHNIDQYTTEEYQLIYDQSTYPNYGLGKKVSGLNYPAMVRGIVEYLNYNHIDLNKKVCTVIGRSRNIGVPLINYLNSKNATLIICNSETPLEITIDLVKKADYVFAICDAPNLLNYFDFSPNTIVFDAGAFNKLSNNFEGIIKLFSEYPSSVYNIALLESLKNERNLHITPIVNGVGLLTRIGLFYNYLDFYKTFKER